MSEELVKTLTRLETKLEFIEQTVAELRVEVKASKLPVLPVTGGLVGIAAAVWTGYLQASGQA